jgi:N-acetylmuramic acid 6-phosphate (MurNAc-6-P) etherase
VNVHLKNAKLVERARTILQRILGVDRETAGRALKIAGNVLNTAILL